MWQSIIVVNDFYEEPAKVRELALGLDYPPQKPGDVYSGRNSTSALINEPMMDAISRIVGRPLIPAPKSATGQFRIGLAGDAPKQDIHVDPGRDWAGILYLTPNEYCRGGTSFWRHKALDIEGIPRTLPEIQKLGFRDYEDMRVKIAQNEGLDRGKWDLTMTVPMRFNRLLLFRAWLWHSHAENFGDSLANGRLIQVFFFNFAPAASQAPVAAVPPSNPLAGLARKA